jgi:hypothetical protein
MTSVAHTPEIASPCDLRGDPARLLLEFARSRTPT